MAKVDDLARQIVDSASSGQAFVSRGLRLELTPGAPLFVTCENYHPNPPGRPFQFSLPKLGTAVSRLSIVDYRGAWYGLNLEDMTESIFETVHLIGQITALLNPPFSTSYGASAGGYMALVVGVQLAFERVLAFSPQTVVTIEGLSAIDDNRMPRRAAAIYRDTIMAYQLPDIASLLDSKPDLKSDILCVYGALNEMDKRHVDRISQYDCLSPFPVETDKHDTARVFAEQNRLRGLLNALVSPTRVGRLTETLLNDEARAATLMTAG